MKTTYTTDTKNYWYIGGMIFFHFLYYTILEYAPWNPYNPVPQSFTNMSILVIIIVFSQTMTNIMPSIFYCKKINKGAISRLLRINPITKRQFLYSFIIFILYNIISAILITLQDMILRLFDSNFVMNNYLIPENVPTLIAMVLTAGLLTPISEELLFRGFLIRGLSGISTTFAIGVSAFYFAIYHNNPYRFITLMLFGVFIGLIVHYTNSIIPGIIFHILTNTIFEIYTYTQGKDTMATQYSSITDTSFPILNNIYFLLIVFIICCLICLHCFRKLSKLSVTRQLDTEVNNPTYSRKGHAVVILALGICSMVFVWMAMGH